MDTREGEDEERGPAAEVPAVVAGLGLDVEDGLGLACASSSSAARSWAWFSSV